MSPASDLKEMGDYECPYGSSSLPGLVEPLKYLYNVLEQCYIQLQRRLDGVTEFNPSYDADCGIDTRTPS